MFDTTKFITLTQAVRLCPGHPHTATAWRWARKGVLAYNGERVRLQHFRVGGKLFTTEEAVEKFFTAVAEADKIHFDRQTVLTASVTARPTRGRTTSVRQRAVDKAIADLSQEGI